MKIGGTPGPGPLDAIASRRPAAQPAAEVSSKRIKDPITMSPEARARAVAAADPRYGALSIAAHGDPELAEQLATTYAFNPMHQLVDLTDEIAGTGPAKYVATGEPVTPESEARFNLYARQFQAASMALYNEERAKGTPSADIFDKLIALGHAQPAEFRAMMDWEGRSMGFG